MQPPQRSGNVVKGEDAQVGIQAGLNRGLSIEGVEGVLIIYKDQVGTAGKITTND